MKGSRAPQGLSLAVSHQSSPVLGGSGRLEVALSHKQVDYTWSLGSQSSQPGYTSPEMWVTLLEGTAVRPMAPPSIFPSVAQNIHSLPN